MFGLGKQIIKTILLICLSVPIVFSEESSLKKHAFESEQERRLLFNVQFKLQALGYEVERNGRWDKTSQSAAKQFLEDYGLEPNSDSRQLLKSLQQAEAGKIKRPVVVEVSVEPVEERHETYVESDMSNMLNDPALTAPMVFNFSYLSALSEDKREDVETNKQAEANKYKANAGTVEVGAYSEFTQKNAQVKAVELISSAKSEQERRIRQKSHPLFWLFAVVVVGVFIGWLIWWHSLPVDSGYVERVLAPSHLPKPAPAPVNIEDRKINRPSPVDIKTVPEVEKLKNKLASLDETLLKKIVQSIEINKGLLEFEGKYSNLPLKLLNNALNGKIEAYFKQCNGDCSAVFFSFLDYYADRAHQCFLDKSTHITPQSTPIFLLEHRDFQAFWKDESGYRYYADGYPPDWEYRRRLVLMREHAQCQRCGVLVELKKAQVHHISPKSVSHYHGLDNLAFLCKDCHSCMPSFGHRDLRGRSVYYLSARKKLHTPDCRYKDGKVLRGSASDPMWISNYTYCQLCEPLAYHERLVDTWKPAMVGDFEQQKPSILKALLNSVS